MSPIPSEMYHSDRRHGGRRIEDDMPRSMEVLAPDYYPNFASGVARYIRPQRLIRKLEAENEQLRYENTHDSLTGCLNLRGLEAFLAEGKPPVAAIYVDGTNQKAINDAISHARGDEAIKGTADVILNSLRDEDVAARIGGDEFIIMLGAAPRTDRQAEPKSTEEVLGIVKGRVAEQSQAFLAANPDLVALGFDLAVGGAIWERNMTVESLVRAAETDMYEHKAEQHLVVGSHRP